MSFCDILISAKYGEETAMEELLNMYKPMLVKYAIINGVFDEDLYQELCIIVVKCVRLYRI